MIYAVFGLPGSGKSYYVVKNFIVDRMATNVIVSNIKLSDNVDLDNYIYLEKNDVDNLHKNIQRIIEDETKSHDDKKLLLRHLLDLYRSGKNLDITIIIDEAHLYGYRGRASNISWADDWLSIHRHVFTDNAVDIVLITQVPSRLNREISGQVEVAVQAVSSSQRISKNLLEYVTYGSVQALSLRDKDMKMKRQVLKGDPKIFELYQSGYIQEGSGDFRKKMYLIVFGIVLAFAYTFKTFTSLAGLSDDVIDSSVSLKTKDQNIINDNNKKPNPVDTNKTIVERSYKIICRTLPKSFDYSKVKDYLYVLIADSHNQLCYKKYLAGV